MKCGRGGTGGPEGYNPDAEKPRPRMHYETGITFWELVTPIYPGENGGRGGPDGKPSFWDKLVPLRQKLPY